MDASHSIDIPLLWSEKLSTSFNEKPMDFQQLATWVSNNSLGNYRHKVDSTNKKRF